MENPKLTKTALLLFILMASIVILIIGKPFLMPLTFAALLSMLLLPVVKWLQDKGTHKILANIVAILLLVGFFVLLVGLIGWQVSDLSKDTSKIEQQILEAVENAQNYISKNLGINKEQQQEIIKQEQSSSQGMVRNALAGIIGGLGGLLANIILVLVYIFLFIFFRHQIKRFLLKLVAEHEQGRAGEVLDRIQKVSQKYLTGLALMIVFLWIMYSIGFSLSGVNNPVFFAIIAGTLEIVPFLGNLIGTGITVMMAIVQGGGTKMVLIILITYGCVQFFQTYVLEPIVVGAEVNINPLFTIIGLVAGEQLWGISGVVLAIPILGIVKIVCENIESLKPYSELIGLEKEKTNGVKKRIKKLMEKMKKFWNSKT